MNEKNKYLMHEISCEITKKCPQKCIMCSSDSSLDVDTSNELTLSEIKQILFDAKQLGASVFSPSGGEPWMRPDIWEILREANRLGYHILFYTSSIKQRDENDKLEPMNISDIRRLKKLDTTMIFDFQSAYEHTFDMISGVDGTYEKIIPVMKSCIREGLEVQVHFVPQLLNYKQMVDTTEFLDGIGVSQINFLRLQEQGRAKVNKDKVLINKSQFRDVQESLIEITENKRLDIATRIGHPLDRRWQLDPENSKYPIKHCRGHKQAPLLRPDGVMDICPAMKDLPEYNGGNVRKKGIKNTWLQGDFYNTLRWFIEEGYKYAEDEICRQCQYLDQCRLGCTAARLYVLKEEIDLTTLGFKDALLKAPVDPMCLLVD